MKLEKLNTNCIKATFSINDLESQNISYHSFMSENIQDKFIFIQLLYTAKKELDFDTKNCILNIDTYEFSNGIFTVTIMKKNIDDKYNSISRNSLNNISNFNINDTVNNIINNNTTINSKKIIENTKKDILINKSKQLTKNKKGKNTVGIYRFSEFDNFCDFCNFISENKKFDLKKFEFKNSLYKLNNEYYFIIKDIFFTYSELGTFFSTITEFSFFINNSNSIISIIIENANCIIKDNAISTCLQFFNIHNFVDF